MPDTRTTASSPSWAQVALEAMHEGVVLHDVAGAIVEANARAAQVLGLTRDQLLGRTPLDPRWGLVREDGAPLEPHEIPSNIATTTGRPVTGTTVGVALPDGERRWLSVNSVPTFDAEGRLSGAVATLLDITERLNAAHEREQLYAAVLDVFFVASLRRRRLLRVNPAFTRILGYTSEEATTLDPSMLVDAEDAEFLAAAIDQIAAGRAVEGLELRCRTKAGEIRVLSCSSRGAHPGSDVVYGTARDVTRDIERRDAVEALAYRDPLTSASSVAYARQATSAWMASSELEERAVGIIVVDFEQWQMIRDAFGPEGGREILAEVSRRLEGEVRDCLCIARVERATFAVVLGDADESALVALADRLVEAFAAPFVLGQGVRLGLRPRVGVATATGHDATFDVLYDRAAEVLRDALQNPAARVHTKRPPPRDL